MIYTYETFDELADAMTKGEGILHLYNCAQHHGIDPCFAWQSGVRDFAQWLDHIGCKIMINDGSESFYEFSAKKYPAVNVD